MLVPLAWIASVTPLERGRGEERGEYQDTWREVAMASSPFPYHTFLIDSLNSTTCPAHVLLPPIL